MSNFVSLFRKTSFPRCRLAVLWALKVGLCSVNVTTIIWIPSHFAIQEPEARGRHSIKPTLSPCRTAFSSSAIHIHSRVLYLSGGWSSTLTISRANCASSWICSSHLKIMESKKAPSYSTSCTLWVS
ncbi:hypothetical protein DL96DRAFT_997112 [Flagelloscypha sp. PMI_526]|nr:hypothetical protein DL96DRAFT_997112 [Flagelloscypha sp. PMI_526]